MCGCDWSHRCARCLQPPWLAQGGEADRAAERPAPWDVDPAEDRDRLTHVDQAVREDW